MTFLINSQEKDDFERERDMFSYPWNSTAFTAAAISLMVVTIILNSVTIHGMHKLRVNSFVVKAMTSIAVADIIRSVFTTSAALIRVFDPEYIRVVFYCSLTGIVSAVTGLVVIVKTLAVISDRLWTCYVLRKYSKVPVIVSPKTCVLACWSVVGIITAVPLIFPTKYNRTVGMESCTIGHVSLAMVYTLLFKIFLSLASCFCAVACYVTIRETSKTAVMIAHPLVLLLIHESDEEDPVLYKLRALSSSTRLIEDRLARRAIVYVLITVLADLCIHALTISLDFVDSNIIPEATVVHFFVTSISLCMRPLLLIILSPAIRWPLYSKLSSKCPANPPNDDPFIANRQLGNLNLSYTNHNCTGDEMNTNGPFKFRLNVEKNKNSLNDDTGNPSVPPVSYVVSINNQSDQGSVGPGKDENRMDGYTAEASTDRYGNMEALEICMGENSNSTVQNKDHIFRGLGGNLNIGHNKGLGEVGQKYHNNLLSPLEKSGYNVDVSTDARGNIDSLSLCIPNNVKRSKNVKNEDDSHGYTAEVSANAHGNVESVRLCVGDDAEGENEVKNNKPQEKGAYKARVATDSKGNIELVRLCMGNGPRPEDKKTQIDTNKPERSGYTAEVSTNAHGQMESVQVCVRDESGDNKDKINKNAAQEKGYKSDHGGDQSGHIDAVRRCLGNESKTSFMKNSTDNKAIATGGCKTEISTNHQDSTEDCYKAEILTSACGKMESVRLCVGNENLNPDKNTDKCGYKAELSTNSRGKVQSVKVCVDDDREGKKQKQNLKSVQQEKHDNKRETRTHLQSNTGFGRQCMPDTSKFDKNEFDNHGYNIEVDGTGSNEESDVKASDSNIKSKEKGSYKAEVATDSKGNIESVRLCKGSKLRSDEDKTNSHNAKDSHESGKHDHDSVDTRANPDSGKVPDESKLNDMNTKPKKKLSYKAEVATDSKGNIESVRLCKGSKLRSDEDKTNSHNAKDSHESGKHDHDSVDTRANPDSGKVPDESKLNDMNTKPKKRGSYKAEVATDSKGNIESVTLCKDSKNRSEDVKKNCNNTKTNISHDSGKTDNVSVDNRTNLDSAKIRGGVNTKPKEKGSYKAEVATDAKGNIESVTLCKGSKKTNICHDNGKNDNSSVDNRANLDSGNVRGVVDAESKPNDLNTKPKEKGSYKAEVATDSKGNIESVTLCKGSQNQSEDDKKNCTNTVTKIYNDHGQNDEDSVDSHSNLESLKAQASDKSEEGKSNDAKSKAKSKCAYKAEVATDSKGNIESVKLCLDNNPQPEVRK